MESDTLPLACTIPLAACLALALGGSFRRFPNFETATLAVFLRLKPWPRRALQFCFANLIIESQEILSYTYAVPRLFSIRLVHGKIIRSAPDVNRAVGTVFLRFSYTALIFRHLALGDHIPII